MTQVRYGKIAKTPGKPTPGKVIVTGNPEVQADWDKLQARRRELVARLDAVNNDQERIKKDLGSLVSEGNNYKKQTDRLQELRLEAEAVQAGLDYLRNQVAVMKRQNNWLSV